MRQTAAYARAYARLAGKLGDSAGLGVTLAQWRQADGMVRARVLQLAAFTTAVIRRNPRGIAQSLGITKGQVKAVLNKKYAAPKTLANLWLEFWFGWKPAITDIYTACEVLSSDPPFTSIKGASRTDVGPYWLQEPAPPEFPGWVGSEGIFASWAMCRVAIGCDVSVENPNLRLLESMGLANPALVAFDAIPWSFLLGWVSNVDSYLSSLSAFAGLRVENAYVVVNKKLYGGTVWPGNEMHTGLGYGQSVNRGTPVSIPRPAFVTKFKELAPTRALTAISLLTQQLKSPKLSEVGTKPFAKLGRSNRRLHHWDLDFKYG